MSIPDQRPLITVLTPTYNRAHLLPRAFASLRAQTLTDFEWLIVDDGSSDGTRELVHGWMKRSPFPIRYVHQENAGKPAAYNTGLGAAQGDFFTVLDSDDHLFPHSLQRIYEAWLEIPVCQRDDFVGVAALAEDEHGKVRGDRLPSPIVDSDAMEIRFVHRVTGDKWALNRTDVVKQFPFKVKPPSKFVSEDLVWFDMARSYRTRFVDEVLLSVAINDGEHHLSHLSPAVLEGRQDLHRFILDEIDWLPRRSPRHMARSAAAYSRYGFGLRQSVARQVADLTTMRARAVVLALMPVGRALAARDRHRGQIER